MMSQGALSSTALSNFAHSLADHAPLIAHACSKRIVFKDNIDSPGGTTVYPTTTARYRSFLLVALITAIVAAFSQAKAVKGSMQCTAVHGNTRLLLVRWLAVVYLLT